MSSRRRKFTLTIPLFYNPEYVTRGAIPSGSSFTLSLSPLAETPQPISDSPARLAPFQGVEFTAAENEVMELAEKPPFRTYAQIAEILTRRYAEQARRENKPAPKPVTEDAIKQRMSGAGLRYFRCKSYANRWERYQRARRRIRRGQEP